MRSGDVVDQRFAIERLAGAGGMGVVYQARDIDAQAPVALKVLIGAQAEAHRQRFEREALALAALHHPGIVRYVTHGTTAEGRMYLAMEWVEGEPLDARLRRGPLSVDEALTLGLGVAEALGTAHAHGIVHRDLKPSNLLLAGGALEGVKLVDFGLAIMPGAVRATQSGMVLGTPAYMAPEQARGERDIDARADVFALGCILHECLAGRPAFEGRHAMAVLLKVVLEEVPRLQDLGREVPTALDSLVSWMLAKDRGTRPEDGRAVAMALSVLEAVRELDGGAASSLTPESAILTRSEQRILCVVLAKAPPDAPAEPMGDTLAAPMSTDALDAVHARGGTPNLLVDGTIAVTTEGAELATDRAALAAGCALALRTALPSWSIAIATGRGEMAAERPVGEAIERASERISARQKLAGEPTIDIDDVTAGLLDTRFDVMAGTLGRELVGERDIADEVRTLLGRPTPIVGRERELALLEELFAECVSEPAARALLVTAKAGVGKSRIRHELVTRLRSRDRIEVWTARGDPTRAGAAFALLAPMLRQAARLLDGEPLEGRRHKLEARVSRHVATPERLRVAEFLGELTGTQFPDEGRVQLRAARQDPRLLGDQMRRAWVDFVDAETRGRPLVIVLEDLHWGDAPSVEYVDAALRLLSDRPLFVLALARPEVHDRFPKLWRERAMQEVRLPELSRRACERLAYDVLGESLPEHTRSRLWERSGGNAFFLEELLRATMEGRAHELPTTVLAMVESRLDALDAEDRLLLRAASVFGGTFWRGGVELLVGVAPRLDEGLARLEGSEWIIRRRTARFHGEDEYAFRHALVREAAYSTLIDEDRARGHHLAGTWLAQAGEHDACTLAEHFDRGGDPEQAIGWYVAAATQALEGNDLDGAVRRAERGAELGAQGEPLGRLRLIQAEARQWLGDFAGVEACGVEAMERLERDGAPWYSAAGLVARASGKQGDHRRLLELLPVMRTHGLTGEAAQAQAIALTHAAIQLNTYGEYGLVDELIGQIDGIIGGAAPDAPILHAMASWVRANRAGAAGDTAAYLAFRTAAMRAFELAGDVRNACNQRLNVGHAHTLMGAPEMGERILRESLAEADRAGLLFVCAGAKHNLGLALAHQGRLAEARAVESEAVMMFRTQGDRRLCAASLAYLAMMLLREGDAAGAEREARAALEMTGVAYVRAVTLAVVADSLLRQGHPVEAAELAREALNIAETLGSANEGDALVRVVCAQALAATEQVAETRAVLASARDRLLARAEKIHDDALRASFLKRVPENALTLELARAWLDAGSPSGAP